MIVTVSFQLSIIEVDLLWDSAAVSWFSVDPIVILKGRITGKNYREVLASLVHYIMQIVFPAGDEIFLDENAPIHEAGPVQSLCDEHEDEVKHLFWSAFPKPQYCYVELL